MKDDENQDWCAQPGPELSFLEEPTKNAAPLGRVYFQV